MVTCEPPVVTQLSPARTTLASGAARRLFIGDIGDPPGSRDEPAGLLSPT
jgi:hypothetical protein